MPICIECRYPLHHLYTEYSKADDRSLGKGVRLTQCPRCKRFADKYVEHDFVVLFIDLVLIKPQVYRHLLFNRLSPENDRVKPSIIRFGILLLLFDVYLTWGRIEKNSPNSAYNRSNSQANAIPAVAPSVTPPSLLADQTIFLQYLFFLLLCTCETVAFHLPIRLLTSFSYRILPSIRKSLHVYSGVGSSQRPSPSLPQPSFPRVTSSHTPKPSNGQNVPQHVAQYPNPNSISTALLVSSCTKLFPIMMVIWSYDLPSSASAVSWAVIINNIAALEILLDCGYIRAAALAAIGALSRQFVSQMLLRSVGLDLGQDWGTEAVDIAAVWKFATSLIGMG